MRTQAVLLSTAMFILTACGGDPESPAHDPGSESNREVAGPGDRPSRTSQELLLKHDYSESNNALTVESESIELHVIGTNSSCKARIVAVWEGSRKAAGVPTRVDVALISDSLPLAESFGSAPHAELKVGDEVLKLELQGTFDRLEDDRVYGLAHMTLGAANGKKVSESSDASVRILTNEMKLPTRLLSALKEVILLGEREAGNG